MPTRHSVDIAVPLCISPKRVVAKREKESANAISLYIPSKIITLGKNKIFGVLSYIIAENWHMGWRGN